MKHKCLLAFVPLTLCGLSASAQTPAEGLYISAKNGQSPEQQATDRYECHSWASGQTGFDSTRPGAGVAASEYASRRDLYQRAMTACLDARGYSVSVAAPAAAAPAMPLAPPRYAAPVSTPPVATPAPELKYHAIEFQIDGGYSVTTGSASQYLNGGSNVGLGLTWTPTPSLPVGVRLDGSYSWFDDRRSALNDNGYGYSFGHENIYGGDADLQLDLAHNSSRAKWYLFGGAGLYREDSEIKRVSLVNGIICNYFFCEPGVFPAVTAVERNTSNWHDSWNAGLGFETAFADRGSFFIEARYLRIRPNDSKLEFVPIRVGLRF